MRIRLSGENYFEATVDFYLEPGSVTIPEGNYPYSADKTAGSIGGLCEINFSSPDFKSSVGNAKDGFAFMRDGALTICLDLEDGRTANIAFNGQIKYLEGSDDSINTTFTQTEVSVYGGGNAGITFSNDEGYKVLLDVYGPALTMCLPITPPSVFRPAITQTPRLTTPRWGLLPVRWM